MINKCYFYFNNEATDPTKTLALEEAILKNINDGEMFLYLYIHDNAVIIGKNQNAWSECRVEKLKNAGGTLARRISGGGAVYHDKGNLNFSFITSKDDYDLERQLSVIVAAAKVFGIPAGFSGRNDILAEGRKFSGNAFCFKKHSAFHHGTILIDTDKDKLTEFLSVSKDKIESKGIKSVKSRVCNLREFSDEVTVEKFANALKDAFEAEYGKAEEYIFTDEIKAECTEYEERNATWEWKYGYIGNFDISMKQRFCWGGIEICLKLKDAVIEEAEIYSDAMDAELISAVAEKIKGLDFKADKIISALRSIPDDKTQSAIIADICEIIREKIA